MTRRPRDGRAGRGGRRTGGGSGPAPEVPLTIPGLLAWFDSRSTDWFALGGAGEASAWLSRAGSIAGLAWLQGTASNQAKRVAAEPLANNMPAVKLDGVNDWFALSDQNALTFLHNNLGSGYFVVERLDSSGGASQTSLVSCAPATSAIGVSELFGTSLVIFRICNGGGVNYQNSHSASDPTLLARDVTRWRAVTYGGGKHVKQLAGGVTISSDDTAGQTASTAAPSSQPRIGIAITNTNPLKGLATQIIFYDHVLTAGETTQLANWAAGIYGVAA